MIAYIKGFLTDKEISMVAVEAHGVGYAVTIPLSTYEKLPGLGIEIKLHIHYYVREDAHKLYGFFTKTEREVFRQLISISKIGPKVALGILSGIAIDELVRCVNNADSTRLEKIPGVGLKTAQRLVIELRGKLGNGDGSSATSGRLMAALSSGSVRDEAYAAMVALGYQEKQVQKAIKRVEQTANGNATVEEWIRMALQVI